MAREGEGVQNRGWEKSEGMEKKGRDMWGKWRCGNSWIG